MSSSGESREERNRRVFQEIDEEYQKTIEAAKLLILLSNNGDEDDLAEKTKRWETEKARKQEEYERQVKERELNAKYYREKFYKQAKEFARDLHSSDPKFLDQKQEDNELEYKYDDGEKTLFQETMKAIKNRDAAISPMDLDRLTLRREAPRLMDLSLRAVAKHSEGIKTLKLVPDDLKKKLSYHVGNSGKLNLRFMQLLMQDSPSEVSARNCVDLEEEDMINILCDCDRVSLKVLNLDLCGRSMTENMINGFLQRTSNNGFPSLTSLSLRAAFALTDNALALISRSAPLLRFINLELCSLLTSRAIEILADNFGTTLRGLNIGGCQRMKPTNVFRRSLMKFTGLNYLSVAELQGVNDVIIEFISSRGSNLTDLSLCSCSDVTKELISTVGSCCPKLETLDISDLDNLTDASLECIAEGCGFLKSFILTRTRFSDEAIAAFLEISGSSLTQLCLNKVGKIGGNTAISLANVCTKLRYLDLSWCRKLTEKDLKLILSCCSSLRSLKLFGWTQVSKVFLEELSRSHVRIIGLKLTSLYAHLDDTFPSVDEKFF